MQRYQVASSWAFSFLTLGRNKILETETFKKTQPAWVYVKIWQMPWHETVDLSNWLDWSWIINLLCNTIQQHGLYQIFWWSRGGEWRRKWATYFCKLRSESLAESVITQQKVISILYSFSQGPLFLPEQGTVKHFGQGFFFCLSLCCTYSVITHSHVHTAKLSSHREVATGSENIIKALRKALMMQQRNTSPIRTKALWTQFTRQMA